MDPSRSGSNSGLGKMGTGDRGSGVMVTVMVMMTAGADMWKRAYGGT